MYIIILYYYALNNYLVCFYFLLYQPVYSFNAHKYIAKLLTEHKTFKRLNGNAEMKEKVGCRNSAWSKERFPDTLVHASY